jgi:hypothetical protein
MLLHLSPRAKSRSVSRPAAAFRDRFGGVPLLAVETDGGEDRKTRHHGHDRSLPPAQSNSGADQKKAEQRPARIDDPLGLEHGARRRQARSVAIWTSSARRGRKFSYRIKGAYRDKSRGYRTPCVGRRRAGCWLLFVVDYVMRISYKCPQCKIASDRRWGPRPGRGCRCGDVTVAKPATGHRLPSHKSLLTFRSDTDAGLRPAISGRCLAADQSLNDRRGRFGTTFTSC